MLGRTDRRLRLVVLLLVFISLATAIGVRLVYWQVARGPELRAMANAQLERPAEEVPQRGEIVDRRGTVLATTAYRDVLAAYPDRVPVAVRAQLAERLGAILGADGPDATTLSTQLSRPDAYVVLVRQLTEEQSEAIRSLPQELTRGLALEPRPVRFYPNPGGAPGTTLASQILGFVTQDGVGHYGIEQYYDDVLAGRPRVVAALRDIAGRTLTSSARVIDPGVPGTDLRLTIDSSLQLQLEKELYAAWVANSAARVSAVIIDPYTGELLASASVPGYDANDFGAIAQRDPSLFENPVLSQVYEPGSVMKMFTAAAGLDNGSITPTSVVNDTGALDLGRIAVHNADRRGMGPLTFQDVIAYSRNVATARVAMKLGPDVRSSADALYGMWRRLGVGVKSGVDVSNEVAGLTADPARRKWEPIDLANRAFGQGVAATQLQLARAFSAMANGGSLVTPHLALEIGGERQVPPPASQAISPELSGQLRDLMTHVVTAVPWYAEGTLIPRYWVGGKTGTAQIWDAKRGGWVWNTFNFTFAGFVGAERPEAVIVTRIHETQPRVRGQGDLELSVTSYELFRRIARDTIAALDVEPLPAAKRPENRPPDAAEPGGERPTSPTVSPPAYPAPTDEIPSAEPGASIDPGALADPAAPDGDGLPALDGGGPGAWGSAGNALQLPADGPGT